MSAGSLITRSRRGGPDGSVPGGTIKTIEEVEAGYAFDEPALELGALVVDGPTHPDAPVRIPLSMLNLNGEYISMEATGGKIVDPTKVAVTLGGHVFHFGANGILRPGQILRLHSGSGHNTALTKYWNYTDPLLANSGTVRLRTSGNQPITRTRGERPRVDLRSARAQSELVQVG